MPSFADEQSGAITDATAMHDMTQAAIARAAPAAAKAVNDGEIAQAEQDLAFAETRMNVAQTQDERVAAGAAIKAARVQLDGRREVARNLASSAAADKAAKLTPDAATKRLAALDAERKAIPSPVVQAQHDERTAAERRTLEGRIAAPTTTPGVDADREAAIARDRSHAAHLARTNPIQHAAFVDKRPWALEPPKGGT